MVARRLALSLVVASTLVALIPREARAQDEPPAERVGLPRAGGSPAPAPPPGAPVAQHLLSPPMVIIGAVLIVGGAGFLATGSVFFWLNDRKEYDILTSRHGPDTVSLIGGGAAILLGIPLVAIGAQKVGGPASPQAGVMPRIGGAGSRVTLTWAF